MHMRDTEPFYAQGFFIVNKVMCKTNGVQTARNCEQQALETMMANIICNNFVQKGDPEFFTSQI